MIVVTYELIRYRTDKVEFSLDLEKLVFENSANNELVVLDLADVFTIIRDEDKEIAEVKGR